MPVEHEVETTGGLSRRQVLTRGAIAGGLVWAAPIIRTTAAYATTANGTQRPCTTFYMVTIDPKGKVRPEPNDLNTRDVPPAIRQWFTDNPGVTVQFPAVLPLLTQTSSSGWAVLLPEVTGPNAAGRQCHMVIGWDEKRHKYAEGFDDPNPPFASEVGRRLIFPCPDPNHTGGGGGGGGGGGDDDGKGSGDDGDDDDKTGGGDHKGGDSDDNSGNPNDGGCKTGHDDGDHDGDDVACDPAAVNTPPEDASSTSSTSGTTAPTLSAGSTTDTSTAVGSSQIASDGSASNSISSDGQPSQAVSSDGTPSSNDSSGPADCINLVYLIYCCPQ